MNMEGRGREFPNDKRTKTGPQERALSNCLPCPVTANIFVICFRTVLLCFFSLGVL